MPTAPQLGTDEERIPFGVIFLLDWRWRKSGLDFVLAHRTLTKHTTIGGGAIVPFLTLERIGSCTLNCSAATVISGGVAVAVVSAARNSSMANDQRAWP
jgi:hypothetical protein